uniref:Putative ovule protein n=1 Tax=Solanum chacoense TaxID=4108 RepID=A0A0V0HB45_SOLCH
MPAPSHPIHSSHRSQSGSYIPLIDSSLLSSYSSIISNSALVSPLKLLITTCNTHNHISQKILYDKI